MIIKNHFRRIIKIFSRINWLRVWFFNRINKVQRHQHDYLEMLHQKKKKMSLIYISFKREPRVDPCEAPEKISFYRLKYKFTFVVCNSLLRCICM